MFNRRMRQTARTVVWEGRQAQSCRLDPILLSGYAGLQTLCPTSFALVLFGRRSESRQKFSIGTIPNSQNAIKTTCDHDPAIGSDGGRVHEVRATLK